MKVILLQEIPNLGKAGEVKQVSDGYARNFLIPRKLAEPATESALKNLTRKQQEIAAKEAKERASYQALAEKLKAVELRFTLKIGEIGQPFGSITAQDIVDKLGEKGIKVEKQWIELDQGIKTTGEHQIKIKLPYQIETEAKVAIEAES